MTETYQGVGVIDGGDTYSNFRRFSVATTEISRSVRKTAPDYRRTTLQLLMFDW